MADMNQLLRELSNENTARTFAFNSSEAQKARDFSEYMSNTSHQREVEDLKRAGLNPVLSANSGANAYSASSASGSADSTAIGAMASIYSTKLANNNAVKVAKMNNQNALAVKKIDKEIAKINAQATKYASDNSYSASRYASDNSMAATRYASDSSAAVSRYNTNVSSATSTANSKRQYSSSDYGAIDDLGLGKKGTKIAKGAYLGSKAFGGFINTFLKRGK